ncbi:hypothetical protein MAR_011212, partial [Mya arenaria]
MLIYVAYVVIIPLTVTSSNHKQSNVDVNEPCNRDQNGTCISCKYGMGSPDSNCECSKTRCSNSACSYCTDLWYYPVNGTCCRCSVNCKRDYCTSEGECLVGCKDGFFGRRCDKLCTTYDPNCKRCLSFGTEGNPRDWRGMCDQCRAGMFPDRTKAWLCVDCPSSCMGGQCDPVNGSCTRGCVVGRWSNNCNKLCDEGCHSCRQTDGICESQNCTKSRFGDDRCLTNCTKTCKNVNGTDDMCSYTFLENSDTTKDITPVSYMTVPFDEGISCNATFDDSMPTYQSLEDFAFKASQSPPRGFLFALYLKGPKLSTLLSK